MLTINCLYSQFTALNRLTSIKLGDYIKAYVWNSIAHLGINHIDHQSDRFIQLLTVNKLNGNWPVILQIYCGGIPFKYSFSCSIAVQLQVE